MEDNKYEYTTQPQDDLMVKGDLPPNSITFCLDEELLKIELKDDGDIYVNDKLITNDMEIITGLKNFLIKTNSI